MSGSWAVCVCGTWVSAIHASGQRVSSSRPVSGMSNTMRGRSARLRAEASGGAASNSSHVSGRAALGRGNTRPGLEPPAILASLFGSVK